MLLQSQHAPKGQQPVEKNLQKWTDQNYEYKS